MGSTGLGRQEMTLIKEECPGEWQRVFLLISACELGA